ncbi:hypothetical protein BS50DRAFT_231328 [Corynespora cassiicola Philippines]|uniref:Uncharacterized protein n=1 Tax=Corynespora cassiicola Philippines TaxID=1448308 RepID=A0A2T2N1X4_CORCC|nr:hypothetical protein BS50DRAFT_231328 [Corynespora cassiicola Philippines]
MNPPIAASHHPSVVAIQREKKRVATATATMRLLSILVAPLLLLAASVSDAYNSSDVARRTHHSAGRVSLDKRLVYTVYIKIGSEQIAVGANQEPWLFDRVLQCLQYLCLSGKYGPGCDHMKICRIEKICLPGAKKGSLDCNASLMFRVDNSYFPSTHVGAHGSMLETVAGIYSHMAVPVSSRWESGSKDPKHSTMYNIAGSARVNFNERGFLAVRAWHEDPRTGSWGSYHCPDVKVPLGTWWDGRIRGGFAKTMGVGMGDIHSLIECQPRPGWYP